MDGQFRIRKLMIEEWNRIRARNPRYSLRAYARKLRIPPSAASEILTKNRWITLRMAERIVAGLDIDLPLSVLDSKNFKKPEFKAGEKPYVLLNMNQFHLISDWYFVAILSLSETKDWQGNSKWIAARLGIPLHTAKTALNRLKRLGLLEKNAQNTWVSSGRQFKTTTDIPAAEIRKAHQQNLDLARTSLERDPVDERDFSLVSMAIDKAKIPEAKKRIRQFRRELCEFLEEGDRNEVFRLSVQFFPLTPSGLRKVEK